MLYQTVRAKTKPHKSDQEPKNGGQDGMWCSKWQARTAAGYTITAAFMRSQIDTLKLAGTPGEEAFLATAREFDLIAEELNREPHEPTAARVLRVRRRRGHAAA